MQNYSRESLEAMDSDQLDDLLNHRVITEQCPWSPSRSMYGMAVVIDEMYKNGVGTTFNLRRSLGLDDSMYRAGFSENCFGDDDGWALDTSAPRAVAIAALLAMQKKRSREATEKQSP